MTATTTFTTPTTRQPAPKAGATTSLWRPGAVAGVAASVATSAVAGVANVAGVSLNVGGQAIPIIGFTQLTLVASFIGIVLAVGLSRRGTHPRRTFLVTTIALTAVSLVPDVLADAQTATRLVLVATHLVAAAIVIPALASRLSD